LVVRDFLRESSFNSSPTPRSHRCYLSLVYSCHVAKAFTLGCRDPDRTSRFHNQFATGVATRRALDTCVSTYALATEPEMPRKVWVMSYPRYIRIFVCLLCLALGGAATRAQSTQGTILGTVKDSTGSAIAGADVKISSVEEGATRLVTTNEIGTFL